MILLSVVACNKKSENSSGIDTTKNEVDTTGSDATKRPVEVDTITVDSVSQGK